jgi:Zn-dependent alcohol dehydrogenase
MGHKSSGIVERVGSGIGHVEKGDKVLLSFDYCGKDECRACVEETPGCCGEFGPRNILGLPDVCRGNDGESAGGLFFGQSSFSKMALVKGKSALNVSELVRDEEELNVIAPMGCAYQTGAGAVTELADISERDEIAVSKFSP